MDPAGDEPQRVPWNMQPAVGEQQLDQRLEQDVVRLQDAGDRRNRLGGAQVRQLNLPRVSSPVTITSGLPVSCAWFQAWNSASSSCRSASSNSRPATRATNPRASSERPERRGPARIVALTGHMLQ